MLYYIIMRTCIVAAVPFVGCLERDNLENEDLENPAFLSVVIHNYSQILNF